LENVILCYSLRFLVQTIFICLLFYRLPNKKDKESEFYEKDKGYAGIHGQIYNYKFCALVFLRAKNKGYKFKLASNIKGVGAFDDVVVEYPDDHFSKRHIFLQLKSRIKRQVTLSELKSKKGGFSLHKYYDSYIHVEKEFNCSEEGVKTDGRIDESLFIIYTNTDVAPYLKSKKVTDIGEEEFLKTGGSVLQFNEEEHKAIYEHLQELPKHREFLSRLRIFYSQADEKEMDYHIKRELQESMKLPESEMDLTYMCFIDFMKDWWQNSNYFLKETNSKDNDPLRKTSEKVRTNLVAKILDQRKSEIDDLSIKYKESAITDMKQLIEPHKAVLIFAPGRSTTLTAAKIHQMLGTTEHIILNLQRFGRYKSEVMLAWRSVFDVLVLESQSSTENLQDTFAEISIFLNECDVKKKFIFISSGIGNIQQTSALRITFSTNLTEVYDDWKFTDIVTDTRMLFLEKEVSFQGDEIQLSKIVKNSDVGMLNALSSDSTSRLLENEKLLIGIPIEDTVTYYIDRTLLCKKDIKTRIPVQGETKPALNNDILLEIQDISPYREKELEREFSPGLTPSTLLEVDGRVIFITDEPGMGKSTLLTHLAMETRKSHPDMWIVRVNVNNYTRILSELKTNGCDENGAINLLTEAAQAKETDSLHLERRLFDNTCSSAGNMVVLIDGVDEVSPHYTEQVIQILRLLIKTKIKKIWVTTRNSMKGLHEQEFQCHSYSLVPFTEKDQKSFLVKFWKRKFFNVEGNCLEHLAQRVVELSMKHLTVEDNNFMGIPLQCVLLAEMFEEYLHQYSTAATVELPEHIHVIILYDYYIEKKWDIYLSEKKGSDRTNVNVLTDDDALHKTFIDNHTAAALVTILSAQQLEKFPDKTVAKKASDFLKNIEKGEEKTGLIIDIIDGRPLFQHRILAEYFVARRLCDNISASKTFMRDHLLDSEFGAVRSMVDRILADKCPVHEAVLNSNVRLVTKLLQKKESVSEKDHGDRTPLHVAVSCSNTEMITLLLEHAADVSSVDTLLGFSPVDYATRMNDWELLSLMMEKRPDIREQVLNGNNQDCVNCVPSALHAAAEYGRNGLLKYLISKGHSVNMALPGDNSTLLHEAVESQQTETIKTLVQLGANTNCQDSFGRTPLHVGVKTGNIEVIKCIVESQETVQKEREMKNILNPERIVTEGNILSLPDVEGNTPLHLGVAAGNPNIVSYLISVGSDKNTCNIRGEYPLTMAARSGKNDIVALLMKDKVQCEKAKIDALRAAIVAGHMDTTDLLLRLGAPVNKGKNEKPIHVATHLGNKEIISLLLRYRARLSSRTENGNRPLHLASEHGYLGLVKYLVEEERDNMNSLNYENETPLHLAARNGRDNLVTYFIGKGCNINAASANGATCLHVACENRHYTTVECLLKHGAEVNAMNSADQTPLHIAASQEQTKIVELLFLHKANFSLRDKNSITALLAASINGHQDTVLFIVQHGGNIEDTDGKGNSIAHFAVANESYDILNFLSERNVSLDVQNSNGDTPLLLAVREGRHRMVQYLVERNSDINKQGNDGMLPLDVAVVKGYMEITRILLEQNARLSKAGMQIVAAARFGFLDLLQRFVVMGDDVNVEAGNGESLLHVACKSGQVAIVQYLCKHEALLELKDNNGNTALHVAVGNGHFNVTRVLVEKGANLCAADASGSTALHIAAKGGYLNIVQCLADSFAQIDMRNHKKETALLVAVAEGHEKIVRVLIEQGAGIGVRDIEGKTALDIATERGYDVITQLLKDRTEGMKLVFSSSHTVLQIFEHLQKAVDAGGSMDKPTQKNGSDTVWMITTRTEGTLKNSNPRIALHTAAENGNFEQVERLVEAGTALDYGDTFGRTALWRAASRGHKSITRLLLANGSCTNIPDCEGMTPIEIAAREGHWDVVDEFLEHHPTIRPEGIEYLRSQLYEASESGESKILQIILKCGISVNTTYKYGYTPLHVAAKYGQTEISRILLKNGANVKKTDYRRKVPLLLAAEKGHVEIVRNLLNYKVCFDGFKPLSTAASSGQVEVNGEELGHGAIVDSHNEDGLKSLRAPASEEEFQDVRRSLNYGGSVDITDEDGSTPLYVAALNGHVEVVRELLNHGAEVGSLSKNGWSPLNSAADKGHVEVVRDLLKNGARVEIANNDGWTPLNSAAHKGHIDVVRELLKRGARVESANNNGWTPLNSAADKGHVDVVRELLKHDARLESVSKNGWTPLKSAASKGHVYVVRDLLKYGARAESVSNDGWTPLNSAADKGHIDVVRELLKHGASVERVSKNGWTPLNSACHKGHVDVVRDLLKHGARVESANNDGWTPLNSAAHKGHVDVVRVLLTHSARVESVNNDGWTPLSSACDKGHVEVVRELLKHGDSVERVSKNGWTPLNSAAHKGHVDVVRDLLKHGSRVESSNNDGWTPLNSAAGKGHVDVVRELLKHGARVENANKDGWTPLLSAADKGHVDVIRELLKHGARVDSVNKNGWTPLNAAACEGHVEVVRELLKQGASVESANNDGWTPLNNAVDEGHVEVVRELLKHGASVQSESSNGYTPLKLANKKGYVDVALELLKHGASE